MRDFRNLLAGMAALLRRFQVDQAGQIAIIFGLSSIALFLSVGASIDLARAFTVRQKMSEVAALACQYASTPSILKLQNAGAGTTLYTAAVTSYLTQNWQSQKIAQSQSTAMPFSAVLNGQSNVQVTATVPTTLMQIAHISTIPVSVSQHCFDVPPTTSNTNLITESFENACSKYCLTQPNGQSGGRSQPTLTFPSQPGFQGTSGQFWYIIGYCLEEDLVGVVDSSVPDGTHSAELDCDNGSYTAGNSSISTKVYMSAGSYELRYNFASRIDYPNYDPTYICGSTADDVSWANDTTTASNGSALRTNEINVYLDKDSTGAAPLHTTLDGTQQLAGANMIDVCVYAATWIERSVRINVTTPGNYWLSFAADGANDSFGGQLDNIRLCQLSCSGTLNDNFPPSWQAANNGGTNKLLFEDNFESPTHTQDTTNPHYISTGYNLNGSPGTAPPGWWNQSASGWATAPYNQITYALKGAYQGNQYIALDGYNANGNAATNRLISRPFLLDPGYYQVSYDYISMVDFSSVGKTGTYCSAAPSSGYIFPTTSNLNGAIRYYNSITTNENTNILAVFMSHSLLVSTPIGGGAQGSATSYTNPGSTTTSTVPTVPPDSANWQSYNANVVNPVIDVCAYADSFRWVPRSVAIEITKPGIYWLSFSSQTSKADGNGGGIDDVKLTALGSPTMSSPPTSPLVVIPTPSPASGSTYTNSGQFTGFSIVADPFVMPAP